MDCSGEDKTSADSVIVRSFYHWQSDFSLNDTQDKFLEDLKVEEIYLHLFDVVWDGEKAIPTAITEISSHPSQKIKPVVYITTDVFANLDSSEISELVENIGTKISNAMLDFPYEELQFDCDWMPSIKDKYFFFLEEMKAHFPKKIISSTVRLYQYKYPDLAGVPPVDKALLMYYNMGELTNYAEPNSILNNKIGNQYLGFNVYPLPIDIALPNFEWCLHFRLNQLQQITNHFDSDDLKNGSLFTKLDDRNYTFTKDTVIESTYYRFGDQIRFENSPEADLLEAAKSLLVEINQDTTRIIFYDLRENTKEDYEKLDAVYTVFE
ncbi:MAG: hypothetical protein ACI857_002468 [Arenicella sp.]